MKWTPEQEQALIDGVIAGETVEQQADRLGRTTYGIDRKRKSLRQQGRLDLRRGRPWTPAEDAELLASHLPDEEIAPRFQRSVSSLKNRRLLLRRGKPIAEPFVERIRTVITPWTSVADGVLARTVTSI